MAEDFNDSKTIQAQSSETISGGGTGSASDIDYVRPSEIPDQDLYHGHSFIRNGFFVRTLKLLVYNIFFWQPLQV